jgi:hypothetical protein
MLEAHGIGFSLTFLMAIPFSISKHALLTCFPSATIECLGSRCPIARMEAFQNQLHYDFQAFYLKRYHGLSIDSWPHGVIL